MMHLPSSLSAAVCAGLLMLGTSHATAQQYGLRNSFRIDNSHSGVGSQVNIFTGWQMQIPGPFVSTGGNSHVVGGCLSQGACTVSSDYGTLRVTGSGNATNCATSGVGLRLDQVPQAQFFDTITVVSASLPQGTPVQLVVGIVLDGFATVTDTNPYVDFGAAFAVGSVQPAVANGGGSAIAYVSTTVGGSMQAVGEINVTMIANGVGGLGLPPRSATFACDLVAQMSVECLTPGAAVQWASGGPYPSVWASVTQAGGGCGANSPVLAATLPVLGQAQSWSVTGATPNQPAFFVVSFGPPVSTPFGPCVVSVDLPNAISRFAAVTDAAGGFAFGLALPVAPGLAGLQFTAQTLVMSPGGPLLGVGQLTNALAVRLGI